MGQDYSKARMSFFRAPISNKWPELEITLFMVYEYVTSLYAKSRTICLRGLEDEKKQREFKGWHLDYITPSCTVTYCDDKSVKEHSGIICMDLDDIEDVEDLFQKLLSDPYFETLLLFRSPRGNGLKWFVPIDLSKYDHKTWFAAIRNYLMKSYGLSEKQVDPACANVSRACWLCHDEHAYIKPELLEHY